MKNNLSARDFYFLVVLIIISTVQSSGVSRGMNQDNWIPLLLSSVFVLPCMLLFARMIRLAPGKDIFQMAESVLGKGGAKVFHALFLLFSLYTQGLILYNSGLFIKSASLYTMPFPVILILFFLPALHLAKSGTKALGKWGLILFGLSIVLLTAISLFSIPVARMHNLLPVLETPLPKIAASTVSYIPYPYGETVLLLTLEGDFSRNVDSHPYRSYLLGALTGGLYLTVVSIRTIAILGPFFSEHIFLSTFKAVSVLKIGTFLQRTEAVSGTVFILFGIVKLAISMISAAKSLSALIGEKDSVGMLFPVGFISLAAAPALFRNYLQFFEYTPVYRRIAPFFQFLLPAIIWIGLEINRRKKSKLPANPAEKPARKQTPRPKDYGVFESNWSDEW